MPPHGLVRTWAHRECGKGEAHIEAKVKEEMAET